MYMSGSLPSNHITLSYIHHLRYSRWLYDCGSPLLDRLHAMGKAIGITDAL